MRPFDMHRANWPLRAEQETLLRAALLPGAEALAAWRAWRREMASPPGDVASRRLLPLLYHNLRNLGLNDPLLQYCQNLYRQTWLRNQGALRDLAHVLELWQKQGIEALLLKGMALALGYYHDLGLRPMHDLDFLVRPQDALRAAESLAAEGWSLWPNPERRLDAQEVDRNFEFHFTRGRGTTIDLHWQSMPLPSPATDEAYWQGAVELRARGVACLVMDPADMLCYGLVHGMKHQDKGATRMLADMHTIIVKAGPSLDWERLVRQIRDNHLVLPMRSLFRYLRVLLRTPIPNAARARVAAMEVSTRDWRVYYVLTHLPAGAAQAMKGSLRLSNAYLRSRQDALVSGAPHSMAGFLKQRWELRHAWQAPFAFASKALHALGWRRRP